MRQSRHRSIIETDKKKRGNVLRKMELDQSTLIEDEQNHFIEDMVSKKKYYSSDDSDEELEDRLTGLKQDILTIKIPADHPL